MEIRGTFVAAKPIRVFFSHECPRISTNGARIQTHPRLASLWLALALLLVFAGNLLDEFVIGGIHSHDFAVDDDLRDAAQQSINPATAGFAWGAASSAAGFLPGIAHKIYGIRLGRAILPGKQG